ncbi:MAG: hypothetical protein PHU51_01500 [Candidatus Nanoarchaeia archaeon]|nr:hypothetical protein [Candidatus Nanoarchaeia archaeon]
MTNTIYFPQKNWNFYDTLLKKLGKLDSNSSNEKFNKENKEAYLFLADINLININSNGSEILSIELSELGRKYYLNKFCTNEINEANDLIKTTLLNYSLVQLIIRLFWGKSNINSDNVFNLLIHHKINCKKQYIGTFLSLLNKFEIITYSKKHNTVKINTESIDISESKDYIVSPQTPYSNLMKIKQMISEGNEEICWFEKHFSPKMYELLASYSNCSRINKINLLTGYNQITDVTRNEFKRLKQELSHKEISIDHKILLDKTTINTIHGRWFISKDKVFNIPPINTVLQGQVDEIILRKSKPDFESWWKQSKNIIDDWNEIKLKLGENNE